MGRFDNLGIQLRQRGLNLREGFEVGGQLGRALIVTSVSDTAKR